jgi:tRNA(Ile2) C34 agmatinyltransferase TiaS
MKVYFGFDDTDNHDSPYGTGKLVRWFQRKLPEECECLGVVRQQLFLCDAIPFTSHNSAACLIVEIPNPSLVESLIGAAASHIKRHAAAGSDPGLCVVTERDRSLQNIIDFGRYCTHAVATQQEALQAAEAAHLSGHGGTNDGVIGAAAAVGLTLSGWSGRFIELGDLRKWAEETTVSELIQSGIEIVSIDRDAKIPAPSDVVITNGWIRPRLIGHRPVLLVAPRGQSMWENVYRKRSKKVHPAARAELLEAPN